MKGSGKEILLSILGDLSTKQLKREELPDATSRLRAGLLLHGSTAEESFESASRVIWASEENNDGVQRQGIALANGMTFITDLYDRVFTHPELKSWVLAGFPDIDEKDYDAFEWTLWLLVSMVQMFPRYIPIERSGAIDIDEWVKMMSRKYKYHFQDRQKPKL